MLGLKIDRLSALYTKYEFSPSQIYNADETGVSCVHKPSKVCVEKGQKTVWAVTSGEKGQTNTILACGSASGHSLPPMIIFPKERISLELMKGAPPGTLFTGTKCGWINGSTFFKWLQFFVAQIPPQRPVLLLYDGHASHISSEIIDYAVLHDIMIVCLPAHSSHLLQPLDVAVFKSFKVFFNSACRAFLHRYPGKVITVYDISPLVGEAWPKALTPENLISGFRHSGIYPLCPEKVTAEKLAPSASTHHSGEKSIDEILAVPESEKRETKKQQPGFVVSGRCITEEEFRREVKQRELDKTAAEQQKKERREEREKRKKEREAEREKKRKQTKRGRRKKTQESDDESDTESSYHCGECGQPYGEDDELWIGCDGECNGWYHILCVGIAEQSIPENFYCDRCTS